MAERPPVAYYQFCILCAKKEELRELMEVLDQRFKSARTDDDDVADQVYFVPSRDGKVRKLLVTTCAGMGHVNAAVRTAQLLSKHAPAVMIFLGTAASMKPKKIQIGDVVIPRKAVNRAYDKISQKGQADYADRAEQGNFQEFFYNDNALVADLDTIEVSAGAQAIIARAPIREAKLECGTATEMELGGGKIVFRNPLVFDDVDIVSCGMVVDSTSYRDFLAGMASEHMRKADVIDMESFGFFQAIRATRDMASGHGTHGLMIRGISDYAGRKEQSEARPEGWKEKAIRNAAIVAADLFESLTARYWTPPEAEAAE